MKHKYVKMKKQTLKSLENSLLFLPAAQECSSYASQVISVCKQRVLVVQATLHLEHCAFPLEYRKC